VEERDALSLVLFSGTDDKLAAAAILVVGAAAMDRKVDIMLQYWALDAFRKEGIHKPRGASPEAGIEGWEVLQRSIEELGTPHWSDVLRQARDIGDVRIHACSQSLDIFKLSKEDLDPMVDDVQGVAAFWAEANGQVLFI